MYKRLKRFKEFISHNRIIFLFFVVDLILLILALITIFLPIANSQPFLAFLIITSIIILIHFTAFIGKSIIPFHEQYSEEGKSEEIKSKGNSSSLDASKGYLDKRATGLDSYQQNNQKRHYDNKEILIVEIQSGIYETHGEWELDLSLLAEKNYSTIIIHEKELTLKGCPEKENTLHLSIPENHSCIVTLDHASLFGSDVPAISIGSNSTLLLNLKGDNHIYNNGIRVPEDANLTIAGEGNLTLKIDHTNRIGIGGNSSQSYGNITIDTTGSINLACMGHTSFGIGGGCNPFNALIRLLSGNINVSTNGQHTLGIGSFQGNAKVIIDQCNIDIAGNGSRIVGIGGLQGPVDIISSGNLKLRCSGGKCVALGSLEGEGKILFTGGTTEIQSSTNCGTALGTIKGIYNIELQDGEILIYGEGAEIIGLGDHSGKSKVKVCFGLLALQISANNSLASAALPQKIIIDGGNIQCNFTNNIIPVNSYGTPLMAHIITDADEFTQTIDTISYSYVYKAAYSPRYPYIKVFLPENHPLII